MAIWGLHRHSFTQGGLAFAVGLGTLAATLAGWRWGVADRPPSVQWAARPECPRPNMIVKILGDKGESLGVVTSIPLSDPITDVPEFHDCQRFIPIPTIPGNLGGQSARIPYDSLYAIFAAFRLDTLGAFAGEFVPVATVYSYGGRYDPLGIRPGFNCLVLSRTSATWRATMVPQANPTDPRCAAVHINLAAGTPLEVRQIPPPPLDSGFVFDSTNYPPVARWDWDGTHQYIGIACGRSWCEVGPPGFTPSPIYQGPAITFDPVPGLSATSTQRRQATRIKGWYDDQQLDSADTHGRSFVTRIHGWVFPNPAFEDGLLDSRVSVARLGGAWIHVATAYLDADYKGYLKRGANKIYMCHEVVGALGTCRMPAMSFASPAVPLNQAPVSPFTKPLALCDPDPTDHLRRWWKIQPEAGQARYVCVRRRDHFRALERYRQQHNNVRVWIPAAARWRWLLEDPAVWLKCETGCCTGQ